MRPKHQASPLHIVEVETVETGNESWRFKNRA